MKPILKSNSAFLATGPSPAWKTIEESGYFMPLVQNSEISISIDRQTSKQVGSQSYAIDDLVRAPNVGFNVDYLFSPYLVNEYLLGIYTENQTNESISSSQLNRNQNFYLIIDNQEGRDILRDFSQTPFRSGFSGMTCASIGNCFLSNYSVQFSVGSIPTASCSFVGSNLRFENLTGNRATIPAINLQSGNASGAGFVDFSNLKTSLSGYSAQVSSDSPNVYRLPVVSPRTVNAKLQNLQCGGSTLISGALIQSVSINIPFERTDLYGLGSNYVYDRKLNLPIRGSVEVSSIVQDFNSGDINSLHRSENLYNFEIEFSDPSRRALASFFIQNAKVNSISYTMNINGTMSFSANYSFEVNDQQGFVIDSATRWNTINSQWQNMLAIWDEV